MEGKRVSRSDVLEQAKVRRGGNAGWIAALAAVLLAAACAAGLGVYANAYEGVFPGVAMGSEALSGGAVLTAPLTGAEAQDLAVRLGARALLPVFG